MVNPKVGKVDVGSWPKILFIIVVFPLLPNQGVNKHI